MNQQVKLVSAIQHLDKIVELIEDNESYDYIAFHLSSVRSDLNCQLTTLAKSNKIEE